MKTIERANQEIEAGRLWRAKEILSGSLASHPFSPELYAAYGDLLLRMGDLHEAGKFLFLAGRDQTEYSEAVQIYLNRLKAADKNVFYSSFPARARLAKCSDYPQSVAEELKRRGFGEIIRPPTAANQPATLKDKIRNGILSVLVFFVLLFLAIGIIGLVISGGQTVYEWIKGELFLSHWSVADSLQRSLAGDVRPRLGHLAVCGMVD